MSSLFYMYKNNCKIIQLIQLLVLQLQELQLQQEIGRASCRERV